MLTRLVHGRDDGPTLLDGEVLERGHDVEGLEGVETGRGLVHEDEPRVVKEVHADRDPLALATGNAADLLVSDDGIRSCDQAEVGDDVVDFLFLLLQGHVLGQA